MSSWIDVRSNRIELQIELNKRGFYKGKIDGMLGEKSAAAIIAFRKSIGRNPVSTFNTQLLTDLGLTQETTPMNLSLLTLLIHYLPLLPFLQQDVTTEIKVLSSSADGTAKVRQTIAVLKDIIAQVEAEIENKPIPPVTAG